MFLDEPTTGLDPRSRAQVWDIVRALVSAGTTVLLTTQYLDEADQLADRIAVIEHGKVIAEDTPGQLTASGGTGTLRVQLHAAEDRSAAERTLIEALGIAVVLESDPVALSARVEDVGRVTSALARLSERGIDVAAFSLEQLFDVTAFPIRDADVHVPVRRRARRLDRRRAS